MIQDAKNSKVENMSILCTLFVVMIHCRPVFAHGTVDWWIRQYIDIVTATAVPFFFIVSGYFLGRHFQDGFTWEKWKMEIRKRVRTLLVPFAIWNSIFWLFAILLCVVACKEQFDQNTSQSISSFLTFVTKCGIFPYGLPALDALWYVRALFLLVVVSPVLYYFAGRWRWKALLACFLVYFCVIPWGGMRSIIVENILRYGILPLQGLFYFTFGLSCGAGLLHVKIKVITRLSSLAIAALLMTAYAFLRSIHWRFCGYLGCLAIPFVLFTLFRHMPARKVLPNSITSCAFGIYLLHRFVLLFFSHLIVPGQSISHYLLCGFASFMTALMVAMLLHRWFPRFSNVIFGGR